LDHRPLRTIRNVSGISVSSSQDQVMSLPIDSGSVVTRLALLLFAIKFRDAVAGKHRFVGYNLLSN
jgi:hypothetical protein